MNARPIGPMSWTLWLAAPMALCMAASLIFATPARAFGLQAPEPVFALAPAFAWAMIRPSVWPPLALLMLGLFQDLLWGAPLGLWPLCLLAAYGFIFSFRAILVGQEFWALWAWYALACGVGLAVGLLTISLEAGHAPSLMGVAWQWLVSAVLFPFAWRLIERYEDQDVRFR